MSVSISEARTAVSVGFSIHTKSIPASIYWRNDNPLRHQGMWNQFGASIIQNLYFADFFLVRFVSPNHARVFGASIYWRNDKRDVRTCSVHVPYLLKNCLVFGLYRPEKDMCFKRKLKVQILNKTRSSESEAYLENLPPSWPPSVLIIFYL